MRKSEGAVTGCGRPLRTALALILAAAIAVGVAAAPAEAAPSRVWAHKVGSTGSDTVRSMTPLADGSALVTGYFRNSITFGSTTLTSAGGDDIFVAKVDASGTYEWAVRFGGTGNDWGFESAVGADGSITVIGYFESTVAFGATSLTSAGQTDPFVLRLNADRTVAWAVKGGGTGLDYTYRVALRPNGNAVVVGSYQNTPTFGAFTLPAAHNNVGELLVLEVSGSGSYLWAKRLGTGPTFDDIFGLTLDPAGNILITGYFRETNVFDGTPYTVNSGLNADAFVAKLTSTGSAVWMRQVGGPSDDFGYGLGLLPDGSVLNAGFFQGAGTFGSTTLNSAGGEDGYVMRLDPSGQVVWARGFGGTGSERVRWMGVRADGTSLITGWFEGTATFGSTMLTSAGGKDTFVAELDANGQFEWAKRSGGTGDDFPRYIGTRPDGGVLVAGNFAGTATFDGATLTSAGSDDVMVALLGYPVSAPTTVTATAGNGEATVTWSAATTRGGEPVTSYVVSAAEARARTCTWTSGPLTCTVTGLTNGTAYTFTVTASSSVGRSATSGASNAVTPQGPTQASGDATQPAADAGASAAPLTTANATAAALTARFTHRVRCIGATCVTVGSTPAGDVRVEQTAILIAPARRGAAGRESATGPRSVRGACEVATPGRAAARRYRCSVELRPGTWRIVTRASLGGTPIGREVERVRIRGTAVPEPVTG